jgi:ribonuclease III
VDEQADSVDRESPQDLARRLKMPFHDWLLLSRALTHRSYLNEHPEALEDNERLEFLGDAVLDFVVGAWLYNRYPEMPEGDLTRMRSGLVHTEQLAEFGRQMQLANSIRLGRGEVSGGGLSRDALICDAFEAVIGALYLDAGIQAVWDFLSPMLDETSDKILINHIIDDPKSMLQEWVQGQGFPPPQYIIRSSSGPDHSKVFEVAVEVVEKEYGSGVGHSKQAAAKEAAQDALRKLGLLE